jgi:hypothetical protein
VTIGKALKIALLIEVGGNRDWLAGQGEAETADDPWQRKGGRRDARYYPAKRLVQAILMASRLHQRLARDYALAFSSHLSENEDHG